MKRYAVVAVMVLLPCLAYGQARPHLPRGTNLAKNAGFSGSSDWSLYGSVVYDGSVSRGAGSGSMRIEAPYATGSTQLVSASIPIQGGRSYTFAIYLRAAEAPQFADMFCGVRNASGTSRNVTGSRQASTAAGIWEESAVICPTQPDDVSVVLKVLLNDVPRPTSPIWVDDVYFGEGLGFEQPPATKESFDGTQVRVDSLGNWELNKNGAWQPFFPICINTDWTRTDWSVYVDAGFNCNAWANAAASSSVQRAAGVGMWSGLDMTPYVLYGDAHYQDYADMEQKLRTLYAGPLKPWILMTYFDNEAFQSQYRDPANPLAPWTASKAMLERIDSTERSLAGGARVWPRFMISGNEGISRLYAPYVEVVSDYVSGDSGFFGDEVTIDGLRVLDNIEKQTSPYMAQINYAQTKESFRASVYLALIAGARGINYWRDTIGTEKDITTAGWYTDLPNIRDEIAAAMPIIREPHWTTWSVSASSRNVEIGTRQHDGVGYLIVVNRSASSQPATYTLTGLPYAASRVEAYPAGTSVATVSGGAFTATLPASGTAIWKLVGAGCASPAECDDGDPCTADTCSGNACVNVPGLCSPDAGASPPDAAATADAASASNADAGSIPNVDGGSSEPADAAGGVDAAAADPGASTAEGSCGCASGGANPALLGAVACAVAFRRRRL